MTKYEFLQRAAGLKVRYPTVLSTIFLNPRDREFYANLSNSPGVVTRITNTDYFKQSNSFEQNFGAAQMTVDFTTPKGKVTLYGVCGADLMLN